MGVGGSLSGIGYWSGWYLVNGDREIGNSSGKQVDCTLIVG